MKIEISLDTKDAADLAALMALMRGLDDSRTLTGGVERPTRAYPTEGPPIVNAATIEALEAARDGDVESFPDVPALMAELNNPEGAPDVDSRGLPWDERIHASTKATNGDGSWRNKRGVDKALLEAVEAELAGSGSVPNVPEPAATVSGAALAGWPTPMAAGAEAASEVPLPPAPVAEAAGGTIPDAPADAPTFKDAMAIVTTRQREGTLTQVQVSEAAQALGLSSVVDLAKPANAEHIAAFIALLR